MASKSRESVKRSTVCNHELTLLDGPRTVDLATRITGEMRAATYVCLKCGHRQVLEYSDYQDLSPF